MKGQGLTPREKEVLDHLASAWNAFLLLTPAHPDETSDMRSAIHSAQYIIGTRVARRVETDYWVGEGWKSP
jgi:hypothetical protein